MKDLIENFISLLADAPKWLKAVATALLSVLIGLLVWMSFTACGAVTRATVRNTADGTSTSVTISTNNPTSWTVSPDVELNHK